MLLGIVKNMFYVLVHIKGRRISTNGYRRKARCEAFLMHDQWVKRIMNHAHGLIDFQKTVRVHSS